MRGTSQNSNCKEMRGTEGVVTNCSIIYIYSNLYLSPSKCNTSTPSLTLLFHHSHRAMSTIHHMVAHTSHNRPAFPSNQIF